MKRKPAKGRVAKGETFDEFLIEQGLLADAEELAIKELIAGQIRAAMEQQGVTKTALATRMQTSRRQLDRLLNPAYPSVTLATLRRACRGAEAEGGVGVGGRAILKGIERAVIKINRSMAALRNSSGSWALRPKNFLDHMHR